MARAEKPWVTGVWVGSRKYNGDIGRLDGLGALQTWPSERLLQEAIILVGSQKGFPCYGTAVILEARSVSG